MTLGSEIRAAREGAGLSQTAVARAAGMSHAEVSRIERGTAPWLNIVEASELCAVVGLDLWLRAYAGGDPRAWDATISDRREAVGVEAETRLRDAQAFERRVALKRRDGEIDRVVIVLADSRADRSALRAIRSAWRTDYPLDTAEILGALALGRLPSAGGVVVI